MNQASQILKALMATDPFTENMRPQGQHGPPAPPRWGQEKPKFQGPTPGWTPDADVGAATPTGLTQKMDSMTAGKGYQGIADAVSSPEYRLMEALLKDTGVAQPWEMPQSRPSQFKPGDQIPQRVPMR